jgi:hypothetical protein
MTLQNPSLGALVCGLTIFTASIVELVAIL